MEHLQSIHALNVYIQLKKKFKIIIYVCFFYFIPLKLKNIMAKRLDNAKKHRLFLVSKPCVEDPDFIIMGTTGNV